jgi:hypothetical protein
MAYEQKPNKGNLWLNKYKKTDTHPALRGSVFVDKVLLEDLINKSRGQLVEIALAGWNEKTNAGDPYISLQASEPYKKEEQPQTEEKQPWEV